MSTHIPGPWRLRIGDGENGADGVGYIEGPHPQGYSWAKEIAVVYGMDEMAADARLIAAAPELLEAAQTAISFMRCIEWTDESTATESANIEQLLDAAIAKAEGAK